MAFYLNTSVLVKLVVAEPETASLRLRIDSVLRHGVARRT